MAIVTWIGSLGRGNHRIRRSALRWGRRGLLLAVVLLPFATRPAIIGGDEPHYAAMAWSVAFHRNLDIEARYADVERGSLAAGSKRAGQSLAPHVVEKARGMVFKHQIGLPLLVAPALWLAAFLGAHRMLPDVVLGLLSGLFSGSGLLGMIWLAGRWLGDRRAGAWLSVLLYLGSPLWYYSRTFFTEPYLWPLLVLGCVGCVRGHALLGGMSLGLALFIKEPMLLPVAAIVAGVGVLGRAQIAIVAAVGPTIAVVALVVRNTLLYDGPLDVAQPFRYGAITRGIVGLLADGAHGLLPFVPVAVVAAFGWYLAKTELDRKLVALSAAAFLSLFLLTAAWAEWEGGVCFGPRLLVPVLPALLVPLGIIWKQRAERPRWWHGTLVLLAVGVGIEACAVAKPFRAFWSARAWDLVTESPTYALTFAVTAGLTIALTANRFSWRVGVGGA